MMKPEFVSKIIALQNKVKYAEVFVDCYQRVELYRDNLYAHNENETMVMDEHSKTEYQTCNFLLDRIRELINEL